jgi:DNA-binding response OmpR family regulator
MGRMSGFDDATVLVVEDDEALRDMLGVALARAGLRVLAAASAAGAVAAADGARVDLLVTDVVLPDRNGLELAAALRVEHPALRVIYLSSWYDDSDFPDLRGASLLAKPFSLEALRRAVTVALGSEAPDRT